MDEGFDDSFAEEARTLTAFDEVEWSWPDEKPLTRRRSRKHVT